jgi:hypothetical protein
LRESEEIQDYQLIQVFASSLIILILSEDRLTFF